MAAAAFARRGTGQFWASIMGGRKNKELLKRQAAAIAGQLPIDREEALQVLEFAVEILQRLGEENTATIPRQGSVIRLVTPDDPE